MSKTSMSRSAPPPAPGRPCSPMQHGLLDQSR
jgi:hypothetical protein